MRFTVYVFDIIMLFDGILTSCEVCDGIFYILIYIVSKGILVFHTLSKYTPVLGQNWPALRPSQIFLSERA